MLSSDGEDLSGPLPSLGTRGVYEHESSSRCPSLGLWLRSPSLWLLAEGLELWLTTRPPQPSHRGEEEGEPGVEGKANLWTFLMNF